MWTSNFLVWWTEQKRRETASDVFLLHGSLHTRGLVGTEHLVPLMRYSSNFDIWKKQLNKQTCPYLLSHLRLSNKFNSITVDCFNFLIYCVICTQCWTLLLCRNQMEFFSYLFKGNHLFMRLQYLTKARMCFQLQVLRWILQSILLTSVHPKIKYSAFTVTLLLCYPVKWHHIKSFF